LNEKTLWPILDQNDSSNKDAKDLLARDCSFVPYSGTKTPENDVSLLMIFNPKTMQASSFKVENAESKDNSKGFRLKKEDGSFSAVLPECEGQDKVLGVSLIDSKNKKWKDPKCLVIATKHHFYIYNGQDCKYIFKGFNNGGIRFSVNELYVISDTLT